MSKSGCSRRAMTICGALAVCWGFGQVARADFTYGVPGKVPNVSRPGAGAPNVSRDGLELYFPYKSVNPCPDIWVATRSTTKDPWGTPAKFDPVNSSGAEYFLSFSTEDPALYFFRSTSGLYNRSVYDVWQVQVLPIVDFDGDGKVGGMEVLTMTDHWGQNYPLCDIGPFGWGDGVVDVNDLRVLGEYMDKAIVDPTLTMHWALDEAAGTTVHNSVGSKDATAMGNPAWQPAGGKVAGAMACDGVDDFVLTQFELNPAKGPFSVLAWVKGGAPGEVLVSQQKGADWLYANPIDGSLMTGLMGTGATAGPGFSDVVITDGQWHRIGLVWDGTNRILLVDGNEMARDAQSKLVDSTGMLVLGAGKSASPAAFWSGLIDDVRIYNRAVQP